jgi:hypothetical protein
MLRNSGIESVLRRELDSLPLPPESQWFPGRHRRSQWSTAAWLIGGAAMIGIALIAGPLLRDWRELQAEGTAARPTPLVLPTVIGGVGVSPLRNVMRNQALGYNILLPANWRESPRGQSPGPDPTLVGRATYTARSAEAEAAVLQRFGHLRLERFPTLPWDVTAELWTRGGLDALEWARMQGRCSATCTVGSARINGVDFLTTVEPATDTHTFYAERDDRVLVFLYVVGNAADQPAGVTLDTLEQIVRSVGLP